MPLRAREAPYSPGMTTGRDESPEERADRNWTDLMQELRVSQTGTQLLAGFLMTLPFSPRFTELGELQRAWYLALVTLAALCVGLTLAPVAMHRHHFRKGVKENVVTVAHHITSLALGAVAALMAGIVAFVFAMVVGNTWGVVAGVAAALVLSALLLLVPRGAVRRAQSQAESQESTASRRSSGSTSAP